MKKAILKVLIFTYVIFLGGCASGYRTINPPSLNYNSHDLQDGIGLSYKYDVLQERGNKKYSKKEDKKDVKLIAVKLTNNTESIINVSKDIAFYSGQNQIIPMEPLAIKNSIKQIVPGYLPYLLLTLLTLNVTTETSQESYPIGLFIGPAITIGNMAVAGSANTNLLKELNEFNVLNRDIKVGETIYGIIGIREMGYNPLSVKMKK